MGFYALLKILGIKTGDEVILQGSTCSVMVNAILRSGACPVFADIDKDTFGSCVKGIKNCITKRTKMIIAQHSFGIPCRINPIVKLAKDNNIFLLEDCALTVGSKINGTICGNFGDAALFSTDHSKPLNLLIGGLIYTKDKVLYSRLKDLRDTADDLPSMKQNSLWKQLLFERKYCSPKLYGRMGFASKIRSIIQIGNRPFLDEDFESKPSSSYPYPSRLPTFIAKLGLYELKRWNYLKIK